MKAAVFDGNEIKVKSVNNPKANATQVLIQVKAAGICGTDLAIVNKSLPTPTPLILGHEFAGDVVKIGEEVDDKWLNKRVTSEINTNVDFKCNFCKQSKFSQCISRKALGIDVDGAYAEYIAVESYLLHEIPESISYEEATFIEPLAAAYQVFERMPVDQNDKTLAIFGLGKLGLLITQIAAHMGLTLFVVDDSPKKLDLAKKFGAHYPINRFEGPNVASKIRDFTIGLGADIVIDATGNPLALNDVINSCKTQGKVHFKSTHGIDTPINLTDIVVRELTLYSSRCGPFPKAIDGLRSGEIKVDKLISKRYDLKDIEKAFIAHKKSKDLVKTIISLR